MYTVLTTSPPYGSRNVGDELIELCTKAIITQEKGDEDFITIFREESLEDRLDEINRSKAILMPGFAIRDMPLYPNTYRLVDNLKRIKVPLVPIGANWNVYPGDRHSRSLLHYSEQTVSFLKHVASQNAFFSCREYFTVDILKKYDIQNAIMTGDPAIYKLDCLGKEMKRPSVINKVVFTPPVSGYYISQARQVMAMLAGLFPEAEKYCCMHLLDLDTALSEKSEKSASMTPEVAGKNRQIRKLGKELGFQICELAGDVKNLEMYETCDLHVGYECHAHNYFLSCRIPSVLIAEDARGIGFNYTHGVGGFTGYLRAQTEQAYMKKDITSGYCTNLTELGIAPPKNDVHLEIQEFLIHEMSTEFRRYKGFASYLDETYEKVMKPFIKSLP